MKLEKIKPLPIMLSMVAMLNGCGGQKQTEAPVINEATSIIQSLAKENVQIDHMIVMEPVIEVPKIVVDTEEKEQETEIILEPEEKPEVVLEETFVHNSAKESSIDYNLVLMMPEQYTEKEQYDASLANLTNHGLSVEDVYNELHNIMVYSQNPCCIEESLYYELVGKLASTVNEYSNPFACYLELAKSVHNLECEDNHYVNEIGVYTCSKLQTEYESVRPLTLEEYLDIHFKDDIGYLKIKQFIIDNPNATIYDFFEALNNLAILSITPTDIYDDEVWNKLFGSLNCLLNEEENLYEIFINLAIYVHNIIEPEDLISYDNELGSYTRKLKLN